MSVGHRTHALRGLLVPIADGFVVSLNAIVCPGLNDVIAELFNTLYYNYGVNRIHGIRSGFRGFYDSAYPWLDLTPESVRGIDAIGGTVLGSSRGGFNLEAIMQACMNRGVNQVYIVGGDGTHRAADAIQHEARKRKIKMTVACVPKTIDNDIGVIDRSFGFNTCVNEARRAIHSAVVEASCAPNGLGIVQLMGRHAGFISAHATLASRQVDLCLIPEETFPLHGPHGVLALTEQILARQGYGVIVVAEGAGQDLLPTTGVDESGNKKLPEIGKFLQSEIAKHFASKKMDVSIKYHDPSYSQSERHSKKRR
jgi:6-phosphofructokinase 1